MKQYRIANSYTAFQISLELDVYDSTIYKWEHGLTKPTLENTNKIIEFMGYDPRIYNPLKTENYELT
ncbi:helix-turn-helix domain-containing protein [Pontimicrobium aquaticum]|uniref:helix-turn-helix domain-containing protein n=1 Tax=Pontimicrobium aquaticum TaxID=2565367 RepID=UPI00145F7B70|nr:helix-turn-helix transcriptional regulator [Pontimicrobium aquaticum]